MKTYTKIIILILILIAAGLWAASQQEQTIPLPGDVELIRNVEYGTGDDRPLKLDILRPKEQPNKPMPVIVWIHGGGWRAGDKTSGIPGLIGFAQRGYFCVSIEYRFSKEAVFPAQIEDCKCAIRWLRAHSKEYNLDPNHIGVWGGSAGGHLVALLGTTPNMKEFEGKGGWKRFSTRIQAVCDFYGPTDLWKIAETADKASFPERWRQMYPKDPVSLLVGGPMNEKREECRRASPIVYVSKGDSPFLIVHGDKDNLVPLTQSESLHTALKKAGVESTLYVVKGEGHGWRNHHEVDEMVLKFFDKHLKKI